MNYKYTSLLAPLIHRQGLPANDKQLIFPHPGSPKLAACEPYSVAFDAFVGVVQLGMSVGVTNK